MGTLLDFSESSQDDFIKIRTPQRYLVNDPRRILRRAMNNLPPYADHTGFFPCILSEERKKRRLRESNLTWAQRLQAREIKP